MNISQKTKKLSNKVLSLVTALTLVLTVFFSLPVNFNFKAGAAGGDTIVAMKFAEFRADSVMRQTVTVEDGKTYKYTMLYKYIKGDDPFFTLRNAVPMNEDMNNARQYDIMILSEPQKGVEYDRNTGLVSYVFTTEGTELWLDACLGRGTTGDETIIYFAQPTLYQVDENGDKIEGTDVDCSADFADNTWMAAPWDGDYRHVEQVSNDFFALPPSKTITDLSVAGYSLFPTFYHDVNEYSVSVDHTVDSLAIDYTLVDGAEFVSIEGNENFEEGGKYDVIITFLDSDGEKAIYTIHVSKQYDPAKSIIVMHSREWQYDAGLNHNVEVEKGKTYTFKLLWKFVSGVNPYFALADGAVGGGERKLIICDVPQTGVEYDPITREISYTFTAEATDLRLYFQQGGGTNGEEKDIYFARPQLYEVDANGDKIEGTDIDCDPEFDDSWEKWPYGGNYRNVEVHNADFFENKDFPAGLDSLSVEGYELNREFDYRYYWYDITVPYTVESINITAVPADGFTVKSITGNEGFEDGKIKDVVITVADAAGTEVKYTIRVKRQVEPDAALTKLDIGSALTPAFDPAVFSYTASVPNEAENLEVKTALTDNSTLVSVTGNTGLKVGIPTDVVITLKNTKGKETKYTVTVTRRGAGGDTSSLKAALEEAAGKMTLTNNVTSESFNAELQKAIGSGYTVSVTDFYKLTAVANVKDNFGEIIRGSDGYASAAVSITDGSNLAELPVMVKIPAPVVEYTFTEDEVSVAEDFELEDDGKYLVAYYGDAKKIVIPETVEEIGFNWYQADDLSTAEVLVIPDNVQYLPVNLCYGMRHLETVYMGNGTTELPSRAFDRCIFLKNVKLSNNLKKIGDHAFAANTMLQSIRLPYGLEEIEQGAFYYSLIRDITVPATVKTIGDEAFGVPFNTPLQMVNGSDNIYFCFMFETEQDEDLLKIFDVTNAALDYWDRTGAVYDTYQEAPIGIAWGEDNPWPNGPVYVTPRTVTILNKDVEIGKTIGYTRNGFYEGGVNIRIPDGGAAADIVRSDIKMFQKQYDDLVAQQGPDLIAVVGLKLEPLNMAASEIAARAQFAADNLVISANTLEDAILKTVGNSYITGLNVSLEWAEKLSIADAKAKGAFKLKVGDFVYNIAFDVPVVGEVNTGGNTGGDGDEDLDFGIDPSIIPVKVKPGSKVVLMDWNAGIMTVVKETKISTLLDNIIVEDGYDLVFYDDEGYEIYDVFYDTAYFEDNFVMMVKKGYNRINELVFETVEGSLPTTGDSTNIAITILLFAISAVCVFGVGLKIKKVK